MPIFPCKITGSFNVPAGQQPHNDCDLSRISAKRCELPDQVRPTECFASYLPITEPLRTAIKKIHSVSDDRSNLLRNYGKKRSTLKLLLDLITEDLHRRKHFDGLLLRECPGTSTSVLLASASGTNEFETCWPHQRLKIITVLMADRRDRLRFYNGRQLSQTGRP
jgi:hypothetical protein